jgi:hypothetical protein
MISLHAYKVIHLLGVFLLFAGLGGYCALAIAGQGSAMARKVSAMAHGGALALVLVAGFGQLAHLGLFASWPLWVWLKLAIWILLGGVVVAIRRLDRAAAPLLFLLPLLGALAAYLAIFKTGSS